MTVRSPAPAPTLRRKTPADLLADLRNPHLRGEPEQRALVAAGLRAPNMRTLAPQDPTTICGRKAHPDHRRRGGGYLGESDFLPGSEPMPVKPVPVPVKDCPEPGRRGLKKGAVLVRRDTSVTRNERELVAEWEARLDRY